MAHCQAGTSPPSIVRRGISESASLGFSVYDHDTQPQSEVDFDAHSVPHPHDEWIIKGGLYESSAGPA